MTQNPVDVEAYRQVADNGEIGDIQLLRGKLLAERIVDQNISQKGLKKCSVSLAIGVVNRTAEQQVAVKSEVLFLGLTPEQHRLSYLPCVYRSAGRHRSFRGTRNDRYRAGGAVAGGTSDLHRQR